MFNVSAFLDHLQGYIIMRCCLTHKIILEWKKWIEKNEKILSVLLSLVA